MYGATAPEEFFFKKSLTASAVSHPPGCLCIMYVRMYVCIYLFIYVCVHTGSYIHMSVCDYIHIIYIYIYVCVCVIMSMYNVCVCGLCVRAYAYFWYRLVTPSFTISRPANHTARPWLRWCNRRRLSVAFMETARSTTAFRNTMAQQRPKKDPHQRWNRPKIARSHWKKT